jgi:peptidoglycan/LPS O-acetylase OafA/YrhL
MSGGIVFGLCKSLVLRPALNIGIALSLEKAVRTAPAILNNRPIMLIGVMSYSIYLWQQPFAYSRTPRAPNVPLDLGFRILLIGVFASASYFLLEQPLIQMRRQMLGQKLLVQK